MNKKLNKISAILCGLFLPVLLTLAIPFLKILFLSQHYYTGYLDGDAIYYLVKDFVTNGIWAIGVLIYILWVIRDKTKLTIISNIFIIICALCGCYIVLIRSSLLYFAQFIDTSTYTLESILIIIACSLLVRRIYLYLRHS